MLTLSQLARWWFAQWSSGRLLQHISAGSVPPRRRARARTGPLFNCIWWVHFFSRKICHSARTMRLFSMPPVTSPPLNTTWWTAFRFLAYIMAASRISCWMIFTRLKSSVALDMSHGQRERERDARREKFLHFAYNHFKCPRFGVWNSPLTELDVDISLLWQVFHL